MVNQELKKKKKIRKSDRFFRKTRFYCFIVFIANIFSDKVKIRQYNITVRNTRILKI